VGVGLFRETLGNWQKLFSTCQTVFCFAPCFFLYRRFSFFCFPLKSQAVPRGDVLGSRPCARVSRAQRGPGGEGRRAWVASRAPCRLDRRRPCRCVPTRASHTRLSVGIAARVLSRAHKAINAGHANDANVCLLLCATLPHDIHARPTSRTGVAH